jgi:phosphoribosylamine--glycine ligase
LTVIMAARGYPGAVEQGAEIGGLEEAGAIPGVAILHAGTRRAGEKLVACGGRVLAVTARGKNIEEAQARAYAAVDKLIFPGGFCRRDIGARALMRGRQ